MVLPGPLKGHKFCERTRISTVFACTTLFYTVHSHVSCVKHENVCFMVTGIKWEIVENTVLKQLSGSHGRDVQNVFRCVALKLACRPMAYGMPIGITRAASVSQC